LLSRHNLINQFFKATSPDKVWMGDMTYIPYQIKIVGWSMSSRMQDKLVIDCFLQICEKEQPQPGLIVHTN
jgi:hypothetical protein